MSRRRSTPMHTNRTGVVLLILAVALFLIPGLALSGCRADSVEVEPGVTAPEPEPEEQSPEIEPLHIVATLFPQYDFVRQIVGDQGTVELLMPPGAESHTYEPSPAEILSIGRGDLFVYTGEHMEPWAGRILEGIDASELVIVDCSQGIALLEAGGVDDHGHSHDLDPHIWTDPVLAMVMVDHIVAGLTRARPEQSDLWEENGRIYQEKLRELDQRFQEVVAGEQTRPLIFTGEFAVRYLMHRYDIDYLAAFEGSYAEGDPSVQVVARIIQTMEEQNIRVVYYPELTEPRLAQSISEQTGAEMVLMHSVHNVTRDELARGIGYLDLMEQNLLALKKGLR